MEDKKNEFIQEVMAVLKGGYSSVMFKVSRAFTQEKKYTDSSR